MRVSGKVYIEETARPMQERIKEHDRDMRLTRKFSVRLNFFYFKGNVLRQVIWPENLAGIAQPIPAA